MKITIIDYGAGNVFSVKSAFERLGLNPILSFNKDEICSSDYVIFPGVGHAQDAMKQLIFHNLESLIPSLKQPVLGICLGMQLMCEYSEEGNTKALGIFDNIQVKKFSSEIKTPHIGWNNLEKSTGFLHEISDDVYFVHSYYASISNHTIAISNNGIDFSAALQKNNFYACQFHPEKSGKVGEIILTNFLKNKP
jgi:imidazole glycerol-phosphate synthase subunit HisH